MKNAKKLLNCLTLALILGSSIVPIRSNSINASEYSKKNIESKLSYKFIKKIDEFIQINNNKFFIVNNNKFYEIVELYAKENQLSSNFIINQIYDRINFINDKIDSNEIKLQNNKTYIKLNEFKVRSADDTSYYWWGG